MEYIIIVVIVVVIILLVFFTKWYKKKNNKLVNQKPKKGKLENDFEEKIKSILNDKNLNKDFLLLFDEIRTLADVEKYNRLNQWSKNKNIPIIYALCFYELEDKNDAYPISLEWFIYILFIFNLWEKKNENIFDFENSIYSLKGEFVFFKYDHDDDKKTTDVYILYYVYNDNYIFCGCYKNERTLQVVSYIAKNIKIKESEMQGSNWNFLLTQILRILNQIFSNKKENDSNGNYQNNSSNFKNYLDGDYYKTLDINKKATKDEIKKGYRIQAKKYHPDIYKGNDANEKMIEINKAYEILMDDKLRKQYDDLNS